MHKKQSSAQKLTYGAAGSALIVVLLALSNLFTSLDLTLSAVAALLVYVLLFEFGYLTAVLAYITGGILSSVLLADKNAALFFLFFFGWYPFLRTALSKAPILLSWFLKLVCAASAAGVFYLLFCILIPTPALSDFFDPIVIVLFMLVFVLYEVGLGRLVLLYHSRLRSRLFRR